MVKLSSSSTASLAVIVPVAVEVESRPASVTARLPLATSPPLTPGSSVAPATSLPVLLIDTAADQSAPPPSGSTMTTPAGVSGSLTATAASTATPERGM